MNYFHQTMQSAYEYGRDVGYSIGQDNAADFLGKLDVWIDDRYWDYMSTCQEIESDHFRQFSPFEFYANEFNKTEVTITCLSSAGNSYERTYKRDPDRMWEQYELGVSVGLNKAWREAGGVVPC